MSFEGDQSEFGPFASGLTPAARLHAELGDPRISAPATVHRKTCEPYKREIESSNDI
jgi:hypothetical protein